MKDKAIMKNKIVDIVTKILFFIAIFSFIGLLGYGLIGAHIGYTMGVTTTGWPAFEHYLGNVFIISYLVCCFIYILGYSIYYLVRKNDNKIKKIILFLSCIPYIAVLSGSVHASIFRNK